VNTKVFSFVPSLYKAAVFLTILLALGSTAKLATAQSTNTLMTLTELLQEGQSFVTGYAEDRTNGVPIEGTLGGIAGGIIGGVVAGKTANALDIGGTGQRLSSVTGAYLGYKQGRTYGQMYSGIKAERLLTLWREDRDRSLAYCNNAVKPANKKRETLPHA
jgi:outer membrane lipoprotein SlyB